MSIHLTSGSFLDFREKSRKDWRRDCRSLMSTFSDEQRARYAQAIGTKLEATILNSKATTIAVYWPIHDEPNLLLLWESLRKRGFRLALPRVLDKGEALSFSNWNIESPLVMNQWGIAELDAPSIPLHDIELMIMPCVGYWLTGHRLGYGGGFYDRTLAQWRSLPINAERKRIAIGVAYSECALPESLAQLATDQPCDVIITPDDHIYSLAAGASRVRE
jgi:5-formyltetrahydrofolate cyclo-ligase